MECSIVMDLMPLYVDEVVSEDTKDYIENHLQKCVRCKKYLQSLTANKRIQIPSEEVNYMDPGKKYLYKYKYKLSLAALLLIIATYIVSYIVNSDASASTLATLYLNMLVVAILFVGLVYGIVRFIKRIWAK